jgi:tetratricopeptide (TPR) repeat protein
LIQSLFQIVCSVSCLSGLIYPDNWSQPQPVTFQIGQAPSQLEARSAEEFYNSAVEFHRMGQIDVAIQDYQNAIRLNPTFDSAYINLGLALIQLGQLDNASDVFHQVLTFRDRAEIPASIHTVAHYNLAIILERQGKTDAAITEVQQALIITPNFELAQRLLQRLQSP